MRTTLMVLVASIPMVACSDAFVTGPPPLAAAPAMASALPLFMVDGVVIQQRGMPLNPADIEKLEIVKRAAATALYGTQTLCPAIIVHTRRPPR